MKNDLLNEKYKNVKKDIPKSISKSLQLLKNNYKEKSTSGVRFFWIDKKADYSSNSALYAVDYMPVNFYKIWHPLMELLLKEQIRPVCRVLEFGCGPGTSTFGFVEFYKYLALDNPDKEFSALLFLSSYINRILYFKRWVCTHHSVHQYQIRCFFR